MKQLAIIGSTASGKSALALELAQHYNAIILSIDSLSIYRHIDIASAKPSANELSMIRHFGVDVLLPDQPANVFTFIDEYHKACSYASENNTNLIIIGGSSFYLKSMLDGLSELPAICDDVRAKVAHMLLDTVEAHRFLSTIDSPSAAKIDCHDRYRLEKLLHLYFETNVAPSQWFALHPPQPILSNCPVLNLSIDRTLLRERISLRTELMLANGLIDEVASLEKTYGRRPNSMKAIGIIETLDYLDGHCDKQTLSESITTHTAQLAKRQNTFNAHQFHTIIHGSAAELSLHAQSILS